MSNSKDKIRKTCIDNANELAKQEGFNNAKEFVQSTGYSLNPNNKDVSPAARNAAERKAGDFTRNLTLLTLYQSIGNEIDLGAYNWINKFEMTKLEQGNSKMYTANILTGLKNYGESEFVPTSSTLPQCDVHTISFYKTNTTANADRVVHEWGRKWKKPLTIERNEWIPYFISGKLQEFIARITEDVHKSLHFAKLSLIQNLITRMKTGTNSNGNNEGMFKIINNPPGVNNLLDVFTKVVFPNLKEMEFYNHDYNLGRIAPSGQTQTNTTNTTTKNSDILLFVNNKTYTKLTTGVLSQVFNNKLLEISSWLPKENIIPVSRMIRVGDENTAIDTTATDLIPENEILVITKDAIKGLVMVDQSESQSWAENMTTQLVAHLWLVYGIIPWEKGFVVRTNALTVLPSNPAGN